jgi:1-acyl-sn-glycerol-3-phosphate acyltransferase
MPYRFIVANAYYNNLFLRPGLWLLGGYRAYPHPSMRYGLELSYRLLEDNQTIMIFPEGRVNRTGGELPAKRGVAELAKHKNTKVIPISITKDRSKILKRFNVTFGKPEDMSRLDPEQIMQKVRDLAS